jgi:hypothetical protein
MVRSAGARPQLSSGGSLFEHHAQIAPRSSILSEEDVISKLAVGAHTAVLATTPAQPRFQSPGEPKCGCTGLRVIEAGCATESAIANRNVEVARPRSGPGGPHRRPPGGAGSRRPHMDLRIVRGSRRVVAPANSSRPNPPFAVCTYEFVMKSAVCGQAQRVRLVFSALTQIYPVRYRARSVASNRDRDIGCQVLGYTLSPGMHALEELPEPFATVIKPCLPRAVQRTIIGEQGQ